LISDLGQRVSQERFPDADWAHDHRIVRGGEELQ
jgi:hypothetical protein